MATQFSFFNLEIAWQRRAYGCNRNFQTLTTVGCTTHDVQKLFFAYIDFGDAQFVSIWMLSTLNHVTHFYAVEHTSYGQYVIHFQTRHCNLVS
ncbi:Uncharacterised protein [Vibrio cholerae]|uniref:Uncharacterized protein n=1 Tax=Vibrio cholerae TaxID=666 RepID=A0A655QDP4_VIBCL|nr:Uncharacterised protein [Vibrio cholerae]CSA12873.1 Uncharacterised protein [Vibrio cholerae]CSA39678.1 Uncharacterised protein [Vibrio cholerae]CSA50107.1 Uncharacterised protein [Vibrio cholerae]CSB15830.1 Uncharacterised protein [Vibrio cholerae]